MNIAYSRALTTTDRQIASQIIKRQYAESGYTVSEADIDDKMVHFLDQKTAQVYLAQYENTPLATISIIGDSSAGLPLDELYKTEIDTLRARGLRLAEVSQLAVDTKHALEFLPEKILKRNLLLFPFFQIILQSAIQKKIDALCIAINPKHDFFYTTLGFETIGELKYYTSFNNAPAFAKILRLDTLTKKKEETNFLSRMMSDIPPIDPLVFTGEQKLIFPLEISQK